MAETSHNGHNGHNGQTNGQANGHAKHGGVRFEPTDVDARNLYIFASMIILTVVVASIAMWFLYGFLSRAETERQNERLPTLVLEATQDNKPGQRLPNDGGKHGPILEGIKGIDPSAPRSGVMGYTSLSQITKEKGEKHLGEYGYHPDDPKYGYIPIESAIEMVLADPKALPARDKSPNVPIGSVKNPYSFYPSVSSSGRKPLGETRP
jgi:hypothetical protein